MRMWFSVFIAAVMLVGCAQMEIQKNIRTLNRIQLGDSQESVFDAMGLPDLQQEIGPQRMVAYYRTATTKGSGKVLTKEACTPIAFENGKVVAVGEDPSERWLQEESVRKGQAEAAEAEQLADEQAAMAKKKSDTVRRKRIAKLEAQVKPVPASNAALNLKLYQQLLNLDPHNARYQKKVGHYTARLASQKEARKLRAQQAAIKKEHDNWEKGREARNKRLRHYTGNGTAEMAVHDMGDGAIYVWVKNVSRQIITTHPDHFTLLDNHHQKVPCSVSETLDSVLEPGSISHGKIEYRKGVILGELIFENRESGKIDKSLQ